jgi:hypothetical protein
VLLHQHNADGSLLYAYPRVQFKVLQRTAHLVGIAEGGELVSRLWAQVNHARLGAEELPVLEAALTRRREQLGQAVTSIAYRFRTPWLGLNQDNFHRYEANRDSTERRALLERILVGNCLALAKAFGHRVVGRLSADASGLRPWTSRLKGIEMLSFLGTFHVNFHLPKLVGIGKSVSRGFGSVECVTSTKRFFRTKL